MLLLPRKGTLLSEMEGNFVPFKGLCQQHHLKHLLCRVGSHLPERCPCHKVHVNLARGASAQQATRQDRTVAWDVAHHPLILPRRKLHPRCKDTEPACTK